MKNSQSSLPQLLILSLNAVIPLEFFIVLGIEFQIIGAKTLRLLNPYFFDLKDCDFKFNVWRVALMFVCFWKISCIYIGFILLNVLKTSAAMTLCALCLIELWLYFFKSSLYVSPLSESITLNDFSIILSILEHWRADKKHHIKGIGGGHLTPYFFFYNLN